MGRSVRCLSPDADQRPDIVAVSSRISDLMMKLMDGLYTSQNALERRAERDRKRAQKYFLERHKSGTNCHSNLSQVFSFSKLEMMLCCRFLWDSSFKFYIFSYFLFDILQFFNSLWHCFQERLLMKTEYPTSYSSAACSSTNGDQRISQGDSLHRN